MMKQIFAYNSVRDYEHHAQEITYLMDKLKEYKQILVQDFQLKELPKTIVWTSAENATTVFSTVPVPAYTNETTIYLSPSVDEWRAFYLSQLEGETLPNDAHVEMIRHYFQSITLDDVFCILAHELTHHIDLFPDEFDEERHNNIWFEEGMCEYLSQKLTLSDEQFQQMRQIDDAMIALFKPMYGHFSLDDFGMSSYTTSSLAALMLNYYRSKSAVQYLVEVRHEGNIDEVFRLYKQWHDAGQQQPLTAFFNVHSF